jgi:spore maturation protein SpmB
VEQIVNIILESGRSALDMALYTLLPIMIVMLSLMKLLDAKGLLTTITDWLAPVSQKIGIPGLGVFAALKLSFVSFAAPIATLNMMDTGGTANRQLAATLALLLTMSQANVVFPLVAVGLNVQVVLLTSLLGGIAAALLTYYLTGRGLTNDGSSGVRLQAATPVPRSVVQILSDGGMDGMKLVAGMLPLLVLSLCSVTILREIGAIDFLSHTLGPLLNLLGLPAAAVLPLVTKFVAGGTAFVGVTLDMLQQGQLTVLEMNRMAGLVMNPYDIVGVALLLAAGPRMQAVVKPALIGAAGGLLLRAVIHFWWF